MVARSTVAAVVRSFILGGSKEESIIGFDRCSGTWA